MAQPKYPGAAVTADATVGPLGNGGDVNGTSACSRSLATDAEIPTATAKASVPGGDRTSGRKARSGDYQMAAWNCVFYYLHYYQKSVASDLGALVGTSSLVQHSSMGDDTRVREVTIKTGLGVAFKMMNTKVTAIRMRGKEIAFDAPTINVLVATQNKLIKEELVDKLGLLTRSRLAEVLASTSETNQPRALVCKQDALEFLVSGSRGRCGGGDVGNPKKSPESEEPKIGNDKHAKIKNKDRKTTKKLRKQDDGGVDGGCNFNETSESEDDCVVDVGGDVAYSTTPEPSAPLPEMCGPNALEVAMFARLKTSTITGGVVSTSPRTSSPDKHKASPTAAIAASLRGNAALAPGATGLNTESAKPTVKAAPKPVSDDGGCGGGRSVALKANGRRSTAGTAEAATARKSRAGTRDGEDTCSGGGGDGKGGADRTVQKSQARGFMLSILGQHLMRTFGVGGGSSAAGTKDADVGDNGGIEDDDDDGKDDGKDDGGPPPLWSDSDHSDEDSARTSGDGGGDRGDTLPDANEKMDQERPKALPQQFERELASAIKSTGDKKSAAAAAGSTKPTPATAKAATTSAQDDWSTPGYFTAPDSAASPVDGFDGDDDPPPLWSDSDREEDSQEVEKCAKKQQNRKTSTAAAAAAAISDNRMSQEQEIETPSPKQQLPAAPKPTPATKPALIRKPTIGPAAATRFGAAAAAAIPAAATTAGKTRPSTAATAAATGSGASVAGNNNRGAKGPPPPSNICPTRIAETGKGVEKTREATTPAAATAAAVAAATVSAGAKANERKASGADAAVAKREDATLAAAGAAGRRIGGAGGGTGGGKTKKAKKGKGTVVTVDNVDAIATAKMGYSVIERWVRAVASHQMMAKPAQIKKYFRDRIDAEVIVMFIQSCGGDHRAAVLLCAENMTPPIEIEEDQEQSGSGGAGNEHPERMEDDDLDDEDDELASNPLVQRATAALAADVKDVETLQNILDEAKGVVGLRDVRKTLKKAIACEKELLLLRNVEANVAAMGNQKQKAAASLTGHAAASTTAAAASASGDWMIPRNNNNYNNNNMSSSNRKLYTKARNPIRISSYPDKHKPAMRIIDVPSDIVGWIMGRGEIRAAEIKRKTGAELRVINGRGSGRDHKRRITVKGSAAQIARAEAEIGRLVNGVECPLSVFAAFEKHVLTSPTSAGGNPAKRTLWCPHRLIHLLVKKNARNISRIKMISKMSGATVQLFEQFPDGEARAITVSGVPPKVTAAVSLLYETIGNELVEGGKEEKHPHQAGGGGFGGGGGSSEGTDFDEIGNSDQVREMVGRLHGGIVNAQDTRAGGGAHDNIQGDHSHRDMVARLHQNRNMNAAMGNNDVGSRHGDRGGGGNIPPSARPPRQEKQPPVPPAPAADADVNVPAGTQHQPRYFLPVAPPAPPIAAPPRAPPGLGAPMGQGAGQRAPGQQLVPPAAATAVAAAAPAAAPLQTTRANNGVIVPTGNPTAVPPGPTGAFGAPVHPSVQSTAVAPGAPIHASVQPTAVAPTRTDASLPAAPPSAAPAPPVVPTGNTDVGSVDGVGGGGGNGNGEKASAGAAQLEQLKEVLEASGCSALLPKFSEGEFDAAAIVLMEDADFKKIDVPKGPQLKIQNACRKKLGELGVDATKAKKSGSPYDKDNAEHSGGKGDAEGHCGICWEGEVQVTFIPCGHQMCCLECGKNFVMKPCPACRRIVKQAVRFYM